MAIALQIKRGVFANMPALNSGELYYATDTQALYIGPTPTLVGPISGGSSGAKGTVTLDFGSFPGKSDVSIAVTGQTTIASTSVVEAFMMPAATADHSADEHWVESLSVTAGSIIAGTGFTIYGMARNFPGSIMCPFVYGKWNVGWRWS